MLAAILLNAGVYGSRPVTLCYALRLALKLSSLPWKASAICEVHQNNIYCFSLGVKI